MDTFFMILFFVLVIAFVIGMIKPPVVLFWESRQTRGRVALYAIGVFLALSILFGFFVD